MQKPKSTPDCLTFKSTALVPIPKEPHTCGLCLRNTPACPDRRSHLDNGRHVYSGRCVIDTELVTILDLTKRHYT